MKNLQELDWTTILDYLESGQAALLVGPDMARTEGQLLHQMWKQNLMSIYRDKIAYYYQQDDLFLFSNKISKNNAANYIRKFLNERQPDEDVFLKIVQMKFPIVISINPDTYLSDVAHRYGISHRFSYFKSRHKAVEDVEEPDKEVPLFYNLCGCIHDDESIILDYEDLFRQIASSIGAPGLPPKLQTALTKIRIFFFVGFQFEKWHTQILLRLICGQEESEKYAAINRAIGSQVSDFLLHQFQIEFLDSGAGFIDLLHEKCAARNLLRPLSDTASPERVRLIRLLQGTKDLLVPLEALRAWTEHTDWADETTLLVARYKNLLEERGKSTLDSRDYFTQYSRIADTILTIARKAGI